MEEAKRISRVSNTKRYWLLIYFIEDDVITLTLVDTGTYADLKCNDMVL